MRLVDWAGPRQRPAFCCRESPPNAAPLTARVPPCRTKKSRPVGQRRVADLRAWPAQEPKSGTAARPARADQSASVGPWFGRMNKSVPDQSTQCQRSSAAQPRTIPMDLGCTRGVGCTRDCAMCERLCRPAGRHAALDCEVGNGVSVALPKLGWPVRYRVRKPTQPSPRQRLDVSCAESFGTPLDRNGWRFGAPASSAVHVRRRLEEKERPSSSHLDDEQGNAGGTSRIYAPWTLSDRRSPRIESETT